MPLRNAGKWSRYMRRSLHGINTAQGRSRSYDYGKLGRNRANNILKKILVETVLRNVKVKKTLPIASYRKLLPVVREYLDLGIAVYLRERAVAKEHNVKKRRDFPKSAVEDLLKRYFLRSIQLSNKIDLIAGKALGAKIKGEFSDLSHLWREIDFSKP